MAAASVLALRERDSKSGSIVLQCANVSQATRSIAFNPARIFPLLSQLAPEPALSRAAARLLRVVLIMGLKYRAEFVAQRVADFFYRLIPIESQL